MSGYLGLSIDELAGKRWELALSLLESGNAPVRVGSLTVYRDAVGPGHDGRIHVVTECPDEPGRVTDDKARADLSHAMRQVQAIIACDPRFGGLLNRFGSIFEYVYHYGMGGVLVATCNCDGELELARH